MYVNSASFIFGENASLMLRQRKSIDTRGCGEKNQQEKLKGGKTNERFKRMD